MTEIQLGELDRFETSTVYSDLEKSVLRFAEQWTRQGKVAPELMQKLAKTLEPAQLVALAGTVGLANWTNRFNESFSVELP